MLTQQKKDSDIPPARLTSCTATASLSVPLMLHRGPLSSVESCNLDTIFSGMHAAIADLCTHLCAVALCNAFLVLCKGLGPPTQTAYMGGLRPSMGEETLRGLEGWGQSYNDTVECFFPGMHALTFT